MEEYFFFHLYFKQQLIIYRLMSKTLFIFLRHPLTQALVVYEHANIYYALHHCSLINCMASQGLKLWSGLIER